MGQRRASTNKTLAVDRQGFTNLVPYADNDIWVAAAILIWISDGFLPFHIKGIGVRFAGSKFGVEGA